MSDGVIQIDPDGHGSALQAQRNCRSAGLPAALILAESFWMEDKCSDVPACASIVLASVQLPTDRPRVSEKMSEVEAIEIALPPPLMQRLDAIATEQGAEAPIAVLAAWFVLSGRLGDDQEVRIGLQRANRTWGSMRVPLQPQMTVAELIRQIQRGMQTHSLSQQPDPAVAEVPQTATALALALQRPGDPHLATLHYAASHFDAPTIHRWIGYVTTLLSQFDAQRKLGELSLLDAKGQQELLHLCESAEARRTPDRFVHLSFESQVKRTPGATAVVYGSERLSYAQLNSRANELAHYLLELGVKPDDRVAICVERGIEMVVGTLGILKAGAAYVPVDPRYPAQRRAFMLADCAPIALLTQSFIQQSQLPAQVSHIPVVFLDLAMSPAHSAISWQPDHDPQLTHPLSQRSLAYVIYTSGSTGTPKGVQVEHGNLSNLVTWYVQEIPIVQGDSLLIMTSYGFDITQKNIFGPLQVGASVVLASEPFDAPAILDLIRRERITHLNLTPSAFYVLLEADHDNVLGCVRRLMLGGEAIQPARLARLPEPRPLLFNFYGPTECTILCAFHRLAADLETYRHRAIPIGKPVRGTRLYVLDAHGQLVPPGMTGEIYVAGAGVSRGYRNSPALTAERYLPDPFGPTGTRMYRTGDLGRLCVDGAIEYLGRSDLQVKIRGFRIELAEIEAHVLRHEQVKEVVVIARGDKMGQQQLVAYVVPRVQSDKTPSLTPKDLRNHLAAVLPDYMVPRAFVFLPALPLTTNGKLDRNALPPPDAEVFATGAYEGPRGEIEQALADIWQELLGVERIDRNDSFFELGGTSLLIVQMNERLRRRGLFATARSVFASPVLAALASTLASEAAGWPNVPPNLIPADCHNITPEMLTLVRLTPEQISTLVRRVPGGAPNIQDIYPLAPLQQGILFHHLVSEKADTYVVATLLACRSRADLDALIAALQAVIDRHDILRSAIFWDGLPDPLQVVCRRALLAVEELVLDPDRDAREQLEERMAPQLLRLDLSEPPLMRLQVTRDSQSGQWYGLLRLHHVASDHVAREILYAEISAHVQGRERDLPMPIPYRNHVAQALASAHPEHSERFFRSRLADVDEPTAPFGLFDVCADGSDTEVAVSMLEADLARNLRAQARRMRVSTATFFHAAWALVVAGTSARDDVVFGTVLSGRLRGSAGAEHILGMFINTLPLRLRLERVNVQELIEQTQRELAELLEYEHVPLAHAQRCSGIPSRAPLFSALLNYVQGAADSGATQLAASGIDVLLNREWTNYPLTMSVDDLSPSSGETFATGESGFRLTARTDRRVSPQRVIAYLEEAVRSLVAALARDPGTRALSLSILPEQERQLLASWNATHAEFYGERMIHHLFEDQVARTPDELAVVCGSAKLSYAQLNHRANQLARYLRTLGVGPEKLVGICMERDEHLIIALLATLKSGGAYVPLDPNYPPERLSQILADAVPYVVLASESLERVLAHEAAQVVTIGAQGGVISQFEASNPGSEKADTDPSRLAYVIYTSGSTGKPKGVAVDHRNAVNLLCWARRALRPHHFERTLFSTSVSFDLSVYECFMPLVVGGTVVVARNVLDLSHCSLPVTLINTVPSAMAALLDGAVIPNSTRHINLAGEVLERGLVERLFSSTDIDSVCNLYGPSETTTYSTWWHLDRKGQFESTIGQPIANTQVHVLDTHYRPVPIGVTGEIYIGGAGVTRGYLNRPDLTAERFLPDPFGSQSGSRLYKTGDLGRWRGDGLLEYLGRNDSQVKLRGFRIELGEIESHLMQHVGVARAVVVVWQDLAGQKQLAAYFTRRGPCESSIADLRAHLKAHLPEYMVPSVFVAMESLPLMPNGKLNRRALPVPHLAAPAGSKYSPPQNETEIRLARLWMELLRIDEVGREDDYFELGGQSLLAMKLVVRIAETFAVHFPVSAVFGCSRLRDMAQAIQMLHSSARAPERQGDEVEFEQGVL